MSNKGGGRCLWHVSVRPSPPQPAASHARWIGGPIIPSSTPPLADAVDATEAVEAADSGAGKLTVYALSTTA